MNIYIHYTRLPSEYQEVEYIETTGTQWINTGLFASNNYQIDANIEVTTTSQDLPVFGCYYGNSPYYTSYYYHTTCYSNKWYVGLNGSESSGGTYNSVVGTKYTLVYNNSNSQLNVNGTNVVSTSGTVGYTGTTLGIAIRGGTGEIRYGQYKYFYFKMYNKTTGAYERDFVPCYRKSDNVIGMYDLVNDQFYTNSGTGTFSKGNDVTMSEVKNIYIGKCVPAGIYHSSDLGLISISSDGENWTTFEDKNLGASTAGTTSSSYGDYYCWGSTSKCNGTVTSSYTVQEDWSAGTQSIAKSGFHIPTTTEFTNLVSLYQNLTGKTTSADLQSDLMFPLAGQKLAANTTISYAGTGGYMWAKEKTGSNGYFFRIANLNTGNNSATTGFSVRLFKDSGYTPTTDWDVIYGI